MTSMTQCDLIRASLQAGEVLTPLDALTRFGCLSLSQRVGELERQGMLIDHVPVRTLTGKHVMSYRLLRVAFG